ncbi:redoxin domain-containing protein [Halorientalis sp.]|uniref:redoxin domain-containing protein n=1 Tax=Halorientalis sp. TaxID=1931229 RepID=UPI00261E2BC2|nr:redoxin domain-containing protein [Halorientalis sp.]
MAASSAEPLLRSRAFTPPCGAEISQFQDDIENDRDVGATLYGVDVDSPFAQQAFREGTSPGFQVLSDSNTEVIEEYGVKVDFDDWATTGWPGVPSPS